MELTKENTKVILNENKKGVTIIRKNFKKRTLVEIRGKRNFLITKYRFDNIDLK